MTTRTAVEHFEGANIGVTDLQPVMVLVDAAIGPVTITTDGHEWRAEVAHDIIDHTEAAALDQALGRAIRMGLLERMQMVLLNVVIEGREGGAGDA